jgi:hypothetical protein
VGASREECAVERADAGPDDDVGRHASRGEGRGQRGERSDLVSPTRPAAGKHERDSFTLAALLSNVGHRQRTLSQATTPTSLETPGERKSCDVALRDRNQLGAIESLFPAHAETAAAVDGFAGRSST